MSNETPHPPRQSPASQSTTGPAARGSLLRRWLTGSPPPDEEDRYTLWKVWILLAVMGSYLFYYLGRFSLGVCITPIAKEFGWTTGKVARMTTVLIFTYGFGQFVNGQWADRFGRIMMPLGACLSFIACWLFSFAPDIGMLLGGSGAIFMTMAVVWGINGFVQSTGMAAGGRWLANWWVRKERGTAMAWYSFAACCSTITVMILAAWTADTWGWRAAFRYPTILMAAVPVILYLLTKDFPEQVRLTSREGAGKESRHDGSLERYVSALKNRDFMLANFSIAGQHAVRWGLITFLPAFFVEVAGWKLKGAGAMAAMLPLGMAFGALAGGYVSDKVFRGKRGNTIFVSMLFCAICAFLVPRISVGTDTLDRANKAILAANAARQQELQDVETARAGRTEMTDGERDAARLAGLSDKKRRSKERERALREARIEVPASRKPLAAAMLVVAGFMLYISIGPYFALCPDLLGVGSTGTGFGIMDGFAYAGAYAGTLTMSFLVDKYGYSSVFTFMAVCAFVAAILIKFIREKEPQHEAERAA